MIEIGKRVVIEVRPKGKRKLIPVGGLLSGGYGNIYEVRLDNPINGVEYLCGEKKYVHLVEDADIDECI